MIAKVRFREIYPIILFASVLMLWGHSSSGDSAGAPSSIAEWSRQRAASPTEKRCEPHRFRSLPDLACKEEKPLPFLENRRKYSDLPVGAEQGFNGE
jgi:hypothetical protein